MATAKIRPRPGTPPSRKKKEIGDAELATRNMHSPNPDAGGRGALGMKTGGAQCATFVHPQVAANHVRPDCHELGASKWKPQPQRWFLGRRSCAAAFTPLAKPDLTIFGQDMLDPSFIASAYTVSVATAVLLILLERRLWTAAWRREFVQPSTRSLYFSAVRANLLNYLILAPVAKGVSTAWVLSQGSFLPDPIAAVGVLVCQAVGYALAHAWMHSPANYRWTGHKYHHQFNEKTFVRPVSANATTWVEFALAYAVPFVVGIALFRPSRIAADAVILAVSLANLCIHTPADVLPMQWAPKLLVSNDKHFFHHERDVTRFLSAPILDVDSALGLTGSRSRLARFITRNHKS